MEADVGVEVFECEVCGKIFYDEAEAEEHERTCTAAPTAPAASAPACAPVEDQEMQCEEDDPLDDLLYFARAGDVEELCAGARSLTQNNSLLTPCLLPAVLDGGRVTVDSTDDGGTTALMRASANGCADAFLCTCTDVCCRCCHSHLDAVKELLRRGHFPI